MLLAKHLIAFLHDLPLSQKRSDMARDVNGSHSFTFNHSFIQQTMPALHLPHFLIKLLQNVCGRSKLDLTRTAISLLTGGGEQ